MKHVSIKISGRVQGVYFRASTKDKADELGLKGFVRNERDGSVYIEAEGETAILNQFVEWCHQGPSRAIVEKVVVLDGTLKNFSRFDITR